MGRLLFKSLSAVLFLSAFAFANNAELLNFQGLGNFQQIGNFYANTPDQVTFSSNFYSLTASVGTFAPTPLGTPLAFIDAPTGSNATGTINAAAGFSSGVNFFFTAAFAPGQTETVTIWSGANGTGTVLAVLTLAGNDSSCTAVAYCTWSNVGVSFTSGTGHSITFQGPGDQLGITDITLGSSTTAIPEPPSVFMLGTGIVGISLRRLRGLIRV
jgi:hypothetical protein